MSKKCCTKTKQNHPRKAIQIPKKGRVKHGNYDETTVLFIKKKWKETATKPGLKYANQKFDVKNRESHAQKTFSKCQSAIPHANIEENRKIILYFFFVFPFTIHLFT